MFVLRRVTDKARLAGKESAVFGMAFVHANEEFEI